MAGNGGALELPVGTTQAAVPQAEDIAIPLLYDKTVALVQQHIALQDPAALPEEPARTFALSCVSRSRADNTTAA